MKNSPTPRLLFTHRASWIGLGLCIGALVLTPALHANVYPTNIRLRGSVSSTDSAATAFVPCDTVQISYVLNEPAATVTVDILSGESVVRSFTNTSVAAGADSLVWDVKDSLGNPVPFGSYSVRITAASAGYGDWQQLDAGGYVYAATGIAVNRNTNSLYYGRVLVSNGQVNPPALSAGDTAGILKFNADGSPASEGAVGSGGWLWAANGRSPWKIEVSQDDYVYVNDWTANGLVLRFDQTISAGSGTLVLRGDNRPNGGAANLSGPFITGTGTNTLVWMADTNSSGGAGIRRWAVTNGNTIGTNDLGLTAVEAGTNSHLNLAPFDVALDSSNRIYTIQNRDAGGDPAYRVMRFPAYGGSGPALTNSDWRIGSGDNNMRGAMGLAVDPTGTYVAVAFAGTGSGFGRVGGAARVFSAVNGADIATFTPAAYHDHTDVAWDNVGNLYVCDNWDRVWRVFSPPGANQATTMAVQTLTVVNPPLGPAIEAIACTNGQFVLTLSGRTNINYVVQASTNLQTWFPVLTNSDPCATRVLTLSAPPNRRFFRAYTVVP